MEDLLKYEADFLAIQIIYDSLAYNNQFQEEERKKLFHILDIFILKQLIC